MHLTGARTCTITASHAGNDNYDPATDVSRTFNIDKAAQTITFEPLADRTLAQGDFTVNATASSGLPIDFAAAGPCSVLGTTVHVAAAGSCTIAAAQPGNPDYLPAAGVSRTFSILSISPPDPAASAARRSTSRPLHDRSGATRHPQLPRPRLRAAPQQISNLGSDIAAATPPLTKKLSDDLRSKLTDVDRLYTAGKMSSACKTMKDFTDKLKAEAGKKNIPAALATDWTARAQDIRSQMAC